MNRQVDALLAGYPEDVRKTAGAARRLLAAALPGAAETVDQSARLIAYSYAPGYKGLVCTLIMSQSRVKLGLVRGSELPDPKRLLTGSGKVHRHVPLRTAADLRQPGLKQLLESALVAWRRRNAGDLNGRPLRRP